MHTKPTYTLFESCMHEKVSVYAAFSVKTNSTYNLFL
nr:MAG TPA: hypothetical protein [Caudoviricetes sp.]